MASQQFSPSFRALKSGLRYPLVWFPFLHLSLCWGDGFVSMGVRHGDYHIKNPTWEGPWEESGRGVVNVAEYDRIGSLNTDATDQKKSIKSKPPRLCILIPPFLSLRKPIDLPKKTISLARFPLDQSGEYHIEFNRNECATAHGRNPP